MNLYSSGSQVEFVEQPEARQFMAKENSFENHQNALDNFQHGSVIFNKSCECFRCDMIRLGLKAFSAGSCSNEAFWDFFMRNVVMLMNNKANQPDFMDFPNNDLGLSDGAKTEVTLELGGATDLELVQGSLVNAPDHQVEPSTLDSMDLELDSIIAQPPKSSAVVVNYFMKGLTGKLMEIIAGNESECEEAGIVKKSKLKASKLGKIMKFEQIREEILLESVEEAPLPTEKEKNKKIRHEDPQPFSFSLSTQKYPSKSGKV